MHKMNEDIIPALFLLRVSPRYLLSGSQVTEVNPDISPCPAPVDPPSHASTTVVELCLSRPHRDPSEEPC